MRRLGTNPKSCKACGYDLRSHIVGEHCPECGEVIHPHLVADPLSYRTFDEKVKELVREGPEVLAVAIATGAVLGAVLAMIVMFLA
jgi:ribosomal protein L32